MKLEFDLEENAYKRLSSFKRVYDSVVEQDAPFGEYLATVISLGLDTMLLDLISTDPEVLKNTLIAMNKENPDVIADFIVRILTEQSDLRRRAKKTFIG